VIARLVVVVLMLVLLGSTGMAQDLPGDHASQLDRCGIDVAVTPAPMRLPDPPRRVTIVRAHVPACSGRLCAVRVFKPPRARAS
jgi:hypothetical protein